MDESELPTWRGHSFTLLVFAGIVVLCSIFFTLGMLVGRNQGQRIAEAAAADGANRKPATQPLPDSQPLNRYKDMTDENPDNVLQPPPTPPTGAGISAAAAEPDPPALQAPVSDKHYLQILATKDLKEADRVQAKVKSIGFQAMILAPSPADKDAYYRVWVGPYDTIPEASVARKELQEQGYKDAFPK